MEKFTYYTDKNGIRHCNLVVFNPKKIKKRVYVIVLNTLQIEFESINQCCKVFNMSYSAMKQLIKSCNGDNEAGSLIRFSYEKSFLNKYLDIVWEDSLFELGFFTENIGIIKYFTNKDEECSTFKHSKMEDRTYYSWEEIK